MPWTASKIFMALIEDALENTAALDLNSDAFKVALYNDSITPDQTVATASSLYNAGQWANTNKVSDGSEWPAGGEVLDNPTSTRSSNVYTFNADDTVSTGTSATLANVYGCLVYDDTIADQGLSYHYFGGANGVTDGVFTIIWHATGIFTIA